MRTLMRLLLAPLLLILAACGSSGSTEEPGFSEGGAAGSGGTSGGGGVSGAGAGGSAGSGGSAAGSGGTAGDGGTSGTAGAGGEAGAGAGGESGSSGQAGAGGSAGGGGEGGGVSCTPLPACDSAPPDPGPKRDWNKTTSSVTALGSPTHRGRDLFLTPGQDQWIIGKFAYFVGVNDKDISEEEVDIYLLRNCQGPWEKLATVKTTDDGDHPTIEGVEDSGGRVYYKIPAEKALGPGLHRVHMVVAGDLSTTDLYLDIVEPGTPIFVSDVDGTLTTSENVEFVKLLQGTLPDAHVDAGKALSLLASRGYHPMYMTARPEFLTQRTREFVKARGLPFGLVHTTLGLTGALGGSAVEYKTGELKMLADRGLVPSWAFGNKESDAEAYNNGNLQPLNQRIFYQFDDTLFGGRRINEYTDLLAEFTALPDVCK